MKTKTTYKLALAGILSALAVISFILESLFPPIFIPGAKMGISNIFILISAIILGSIYGYAVLLIKILLGSLFAGNISAMLYSLPAGLISLTVEILLIKTTSKFSIVAISTVGGIINITLQNLSFCLITNVMEYTCYLPYLALIGGIAGIVVGLAVGLIIKVLPRRIIEQATAL